MNALSLFLARRIVLSVVAAVVLTGCDTNPAPVTDLKPGAPLRLAIEPQGAWTRGEIGEFTVIATALAESNDFSLDVDLPEGVALYSGDLHQQGAVRANTQFRLTFSLRIPETGRHVITATARMGMGDAGRFEARANYVIGDERSPAVSDHGASTERNGEPIREYRLP